MTVGEALIRLLEQAGVDTVFGIPGVHTIELYRGLAASPIRHVTPRHEQGAAFMADGYARVTGKPGVCLLITGPGLTNALTAMAQARADSVPMLVITGVNARDTLGKGRGHLHELPDQAALARTVALRTSTLMEPDRLGDVIAEAFARMGAGRPGPVHVEIPTDVMKAVIALPELALPLSFPLTPAARDIADAARWLAAAERPLILAGGGARQAGKAVRAVAVALGAPVVTTVNARGLMGGDPLCVPASPSLAAVRSALADADCVLALGTEFGPTDFDMYETGTMPEIQRLLRVDVDARQLQRRAGLAAEQIDMQADAAAFMAALSAMLQHAVESRSAGRHLRQGTQRAADIRAAARDEIGPRYRHFVAICDAIFAALPDAVIAGDSTQLIYAGNLFLDVPTTGRWFNAATGFGALGYGPPAAIGAAIGAASGDPSRPVVCIAGDGGMQFSLAEIGAARDENADVTFIVWNNDGYQEIESAMVAAGVAPEGVKPSAPDFIAIAAAYGVPATRCDSLEALVRVLGSGPGPRLVQIDEHNFS